MRVCTNVTYTCVRERVCVSCTHIPDIDVAFISSPSSIGMGQDDGAWSMPPPQAAAMVAVAGPKTHPAEIKYLPSKRAESSRDK